VDVEYPESFRVSLPDGRVAFVALGETRPNRITIQGIDMEGARLRYAQMTTDLNELCGLGVTQMAGIARFSAPATFRLKRQPNGSIRVTTNTGISLADQWLRGGVHCIEVKAPDQQWVDVTTLCSNGSIPPEVVQEWSDRSQRTLVEFRINA
jgi:hypothetical protein